MREGFKLMNKVMCLEDRIESCHVPSLGKFFFVFVGRDDAAVFWMGSKVILKGIFTSRKLILIQQGCY